MSKLTQDSGIHTMSSRRGSAFSDSAIQNSYQYHKCSFPGYANGDCLTSSDRHSGYLDYRNNVAASTSCNVLSNCMENRNYLSGNSELRSGFPCTGSRNGEVVHNNYDALSVHNNCSQVSEKKMSVVSVCSNSSRPRGCLDRQYNDVGHTPQDQTSTRMSNHGSGLNVNCHLENGVSKLRLHGPVQLCSYRLLPTRHQNKNAILSILDSGEVCVEFIKMRGHPKKELVCEVFRISPDGLRIIIYKPENGKGTQPSSVPPPLPSNGTDNIFSFENLPEKHWKKYMYASQFVDVVKAKTPKVTNYTDKAKCLLMENLNDFEAYFYDGKYASYYLL